MNVGQTLDDVVRDLSVKFPNQKQGLLGSHADTGEPYHEISVSALARNREFDVDVVKVKVIENVARQLGAYCEGKQKGLTLYWRIAPEDYLCEYSVVEAYSDVGPDTDVVTGRKCFLDKNWKLYTVYMRLLISDK